ncbi:MAG TPA: TIGR02302 family protein [Stellaceae bacterium]|nr:TIGR02302 family protein [Stellaceae bacterium]
MSDTPHPQPRLAARLHLARVALAWELVWPAAWPAVALCAAFAILALFDLLPLLPGAAHAAVLAGFALTIGAAGVWGGWRIAWPRPDAARRRIELSSGLAHRPLQALDDQPSAPLDGAAAQLWAAHQARVVAAVRRLRVGWPRAGLARHDPWGIRSVLAILLVIAAIDAGPDWRERLAHALAPDFSPGAAAVATGFDIWITPPDYTGLPPQFLRAGEPGPIKVATGSTLLAQVHGGDAVPSLAIDKTAHDFTAIDKTNFRAGTTLTAGTRLTVTQDGTVLGSWPIEIVPDMPPTIGFAHPPSATPRAALRLDYHAADDYGVEAVKAVITRADGKDAADRIELALPLPGLHLKEAKATSYHDLSPHPWAGLPVVIRLTATDAKGQTGESPPVHMILPERKFTNLVARAIIDQRRELVKDPGSSEAVSEILGDLKSRPALYRNDTLVFLALSVAQDRLRMNPDAPAIASVVALLWDTALHIEDGNMSLAERDLRQLEQRLQNALAKGAPDAEIDQLMSEMHRALDRYMQALADDLRRHPQQATPPSDSSRVLNERDLQRMLDQARNLARNGDREQARQLLSQLQNMLENLRTAGNGRMQQPRAGSAQQSMRQLEEMMRQQQQLLDRSFRARRQQEQGSATPQPGQKQPETGQSEDPAQMAGEQEAVRRMLGDVMRHLGAGKGEIPEPLGRAERAMRKATGALREGEPGLAIAPQTEALDQLQQGARKFAQQLRQRLGTGSTGLTGQAGAGEGTPGDQSGRDPFGRPLSSDGMYDEGDVKIPDVNILQKTRKILDELRRRAGERNRPVLELDYIDRLLKQF